MKAVRVIEYVLLGLMLIICFMTLYFIASSSGKMKDFKNDGTIISESINEKRIIKINDALNGLYIRGKNLNNPIILFVSSGPGSSDLFLTEKYKDMNLEEYFTVAYWDYRGMCSVYDREIDPEAITTDVLMKDVEDISNYLISRFNKERIYIMGFSGGTHIALQAASRFPEKYYGYFAMAQAVCSNSDNDTEMYNFMKKVFTDRKNSASVKKLESLVNHLDNNKVECKDWPAFVYLLHKAGGGTIKDKSELTGISIPIFLSHCYNLKEKISYIPSIKMYRKTTFASENKKHDYRKDITELKIPVYFISGEYDFNCPWTLVKEYYETISAPEKDFILVPDAAHSPLWENPQPVVDFMKSKK